MAPTGHGLFQSHGPAPANDSPTYHDLVDTGLADANLVPIGPTAVSGSGAGVNGFTRYFDLSRGGAVALQPGVERRNVHQLRRPGGGAGADRARPLLGLRGAFAWEISNDDNAHDLVNAMTH